MNENVVFARVGWMQSYQSTMTGEPGPIGGGKYNLKNLGWERDNFLIDAGGRAHGYFAIGSGTQAINLFRVGGGAVNRCNPEALRDSRRFRCSASNTGP